MTYITLPAVSPNKVLTASYLNQLVEDIRVVGRHDHSGSLGEGSTILLSSSAASPYFNRYEIICHSVASQTGFATLTAASNYIFGGYRQTSAATASAKWPLGLFAGVYTFELMSETNASLGTASIFLGASTIGEIDTYSAASAQAVISSLTASAPTSGSYVLAITASGKKNASSAGSLIRIQAFKIRKTGVY